jgi:hypothetical protein
MTLPARGTVLKYRPTWATADACRSDHKLISRAETSNCWPTLTSAFGSHVRIPNRLHVTSRSFAFRTRVRFVQSPATASSGRLWPVAPQSAGRQRDRSGRKQTGGRKGRSYGHRRHDEPSRPVIGLVVAGDVVYNGIHPLLSESNRQTRLMGAVYVVAKHPNRAGVKTYTACKECKGKGRVATN